MISERMKGFLAGSSVIREMFEEGARLKGKYGDDKVFDFSIGNPNLPAPKEVGETIIDLVKTEDPVKLHGYMANQGHQDVRQAIAERLNKNYGTSYKAENLIMVTGAAAGLNISLMSILNPGDEVIVISPYFMEYKNYVENYQGKLVEVSAKKDDFNLDLEAIDKAINEKTKAIIINNPNNPTGVVYSKKDLKDLADLLSSKEKELGTSIFLISDEPYRDLVYDGEKVDFLARIYDKTIIVYSYSKSLSLPGERIGYVLYDGPEEEDLIQVMTVANRINGFVNAPSLFQKVIGSCQDLETDVNFYDKNRKILYQGLKDLGYEMVYPEGAFYIFLKSPIDSDIDFAQMAKDFNILMVPGSTFKAPGYLRLAYCVSEKTIRDSLPAFEKLMERTRAQ